VQEDLPRRLIAEAIGTCLLVLIGAGALTAALTAVRGGLDYPSLGVVGLAFVIAVAIPVYAFGTTSGAHINPAVTLALALTGRFPLHEVGLYIGAQAAGGFAGGLLIVAVFGSDAYDVAAVGSTELGRGVGYLQGIVAEAAATFVLMTAIMGLAVDRRAAPGIGGLVIGLAVGAAVIVIGPLTGGSLNPARTFGPLFTNTLFGGDTNWEDFPLYIIGPVVGAALAALAYDYVARPRAAELGAEPPQGTQGDIEGWRGAAAGEAATEEVATHRQGTRGDVRGRRR
jgi:glycerol uptake facilitator protein